MIQKKLVATVGQYTDGQGQQRKRYQVIGHLHDGQYGQYITLDPGVSLAGLIAKQKIAGLGRRDDDRVYVNLYDVDASHGQPRPGQQTQPGQQPPHQDGGGFDDDVPF